MRAGALRGALARRLGIDTRALAAFRVAVGILLVVDLLLRARHLRAFYTDSGVLPRATLAAVDPSLSRVSVHALSGAPAFQAALFVVAGAVACLLAVGYRTRSAAVVSWLLLASLQARNYHVLNGGDTLLLVALFVGLFLPLGERYSVDAALRDRHRSFVAGFGTAALLTQVVLVYATNAVFKLRGDAWLAGEAVPGVFRVDRFVVGLGEYLAAVPALLVAVNWAWLAMLVASPLLLVSTGRVRTALVGLYGSAHVGMFLTMDLGLFPGASVACLLVFLPAVVWERLDARLGAVRGDLTRTIEARLPRGPTAPAPLAAAGRRVLPAVTGVVLVVGLAWGVASVGAVPVGEDAPLDPEDHSWKLFAPNPPTADGWFAAPGELRSGESVDLYPHSESGFDRPPDVAATYPTTRWRKYLTELRYGDERLRAAFAAYLCSRGAARYGEPVESLDLYYVRAPNAADEPRERVHLGSYDCGS